MSAINKMESGKDHKCGGAWESVFQTSSLATSDVQGLVFGKYYAVSHR